MNVVKEGNKGEEEVRVETRSSGRIQDHRHLQRRKSAGSVAVKVISKGIVLRGKMEISNRMPMLLKGRNL